MGIRDDITRFTESITGGGGTESSTGSSTSDYSGTTQGTQEAIESNQSTTPTTENGGLNNAGQLSPPGAVSQDSGGEVVATQQTAFPGIASPDAPQGEASAPAATTTATPAVATQAATVQPTAPAKTYVDPLERAKELAQVSQAGTVNTSIGAAKAGGLTPMQAALLGAKEGSSAYQSALGAGYSTAVGERLGERGLDIQQQLGQGSLDLQKEGLTEEKNKNTSAGWGGFLSGLAGVAALFLKDGGETQGGLTVTDENGPELKILPKGTKVVPTIKDGYDMLDFVVKGMKAGTSTEPKNEPQNTSMIAAVNDKVDNLERALKLLKG